MPYEACWGTLFLPYETHNRLTPRRSGSKHACHLLPFCQNDKGDGETVTSSQPPRLLLWAGREGSTQLGEKRVGDTGLPGLPPCHQELHGTLQVTRSAPPFTGGADRAASAPLVLLTRDCIPA